MYQRTLILCVLALLLGMLPGCASEPEGKGPQFWKSPLSTGMPTHKLAVRPLHNPSKLVQAYQPIVEFLNIRLSAAHLDLETSRNCADLEAKCLGRKPEFLLPNPWQTLQAMKVPRKVRLS